MKYEGLCAVIKQKMPYWEQENVSKAEIHEKNAQIEQLTALFEKLRSTYPDVDIMKIKKMMRKNPKMSYEELCEKINKKVDKWQKKMMKKSEKMIKKEKFDYVDEEWTKVEWTPEMIEKFTLINEIFPKF